MVPKSQPRKFSASVGSIERESWERVGTGRARREWSGLARCPNNLRECIGV